MNLVLKQYNLQRVLLVAAALLYMVGVAAQVKFYTKANSNTVPLNGVLQFEIVVENGELEKVQQPTFPNFKIVGGPSTSQSTQWVNGNVSSSLSYIYLLQPTQKGTFTLPKVKAQVEGVVVESREISVTVTDAVKQQPRAANPHDPFDDPFFNDPFFNRKSGKQLSEEEIKKQVADNVFLRIETDKNSVFQGEKVHAKLKLYFKLPIAQFGLSKAPKFDGFWNKEIKKEQEKPTEVTYNGQRFMAVDLMEYNLFPQKTGKLKISAAEADMIVQAVVSRGNSFFDQFFGGQVANVPIKSTSNDVTIVVKDLPTEGKPDDFSGAIGDFKYSVTLSNRAGKTEEPIIYSAKVSGNGNLDMLTIPQPNADESFEVYDPETKENFSEGEWGLSGSKQDDYTLIPSVPGEFTLAGTSFTFFNPNTAKYVTITAPDIAVTVTGDSAKKSVLIDSTGAKTTDQIIKTGKLRDIHHKIALTNAEDTLYGTPKFYTFAISPFVLLLLAFAYKKRQDNLAGDVVGAKQRRARKIAVKRLAVAEKYLKQNSREAFYQEISKGIWGYIGNKLNIDPALLSKENATEVLLQRTIDSPTIEKLIAVIEHSEVALYAPSIHQEKMQEDYENAVQLIADLEQKIKV